MQNTGASPLDWTATQSLGSGFFLLSKTNGTLEAGQVDALTVTVNTGFSFTPGTDYAGILDFANVTNTQGNTSRDVDAIVIDINQGVLAVTPADGFHAEAIPGGSFTPPAKTLYFAEHGSKSARLDGDLGFRQ